MKNKTKTILVIALIGIILFSLVGTILYFKLIPQAVILGYGSENDLYHKDHKPGKCFVRIRDPLDNLNQYEVDVSIRTSGNQIIASFDGTPDLPINYEAWYGENGCRSHGLTYADYPTFWDLIRTGSIERTIEYCNFGVSDPTPYDGIENYKCNGLCVPESSICLDQTTLKKCRADGNSIETITCDYKCENGFCIDLDYNLFVDTDKNSYILGDDILVNGRFTQPTTPAIPVEGVLVTAQIVKNYAIIRELSDFTDSVGEVNFVFNEVDLVGEAEIKLSLTHLNKLYEKSKIINIVGELIDFEVTTYSYTQYETEPIKFTVTMKDSKGRYVYPEKLTNLRGIATLTSGQVLNSNVEYKGDGEYEVTSNVAGVGRYVGKIAFDYEGTPYDSPVIEIDVEKIRISIDTSEIIPTAKLDETVDYTIRIYDSMGNKLDVDNLWVEISFPDGVTTELIAFDEIEKVEEGMYEFTFTFPQVEKFTFDFLADKEGYVRGSAMASVAVAGNKPMTAGPEWFKYLLWIIPLGLIVFFGIAYVIYRKVRGKKK